MLKQPNDAEPLLSFLLIVGPKGSKSIRQKLESFSKEKKGEQPPFPQGLAPALKRNWWGLMGLSWEVPTASTGLCPGGVCCSPGRGVMVRAQARGRLEGTCMCGDKRCVRTSVHL